MLSYIPILVSAFAVGSNASPISDLSHTAPGTCTDIASLYPTPSSASSFCADYLAVKAVATTTTTTMATVTTTVTPANASTTVVHLPGSPPSANVRRADDDVAHVQSPAFVSSACSCLDLNDHTSTEITAIHVTSTVMADQVASTIYPCATTNGGALPSPGPAYGKAQGTSDLGLQNNLYDLRSSEGANAVACCNTCFFEIQNCVQAWWYFYEGCVVSQATNYVEVTDEGISNVCPGGKFADLTYVPDYDPAFHSTGDIAGPCGVRYTNM